MDKKAKVIFNVYGCDVQLIAKELDASIYAYYDPERKVIYVSNKIKGQLRKQTILHELLHAIWDRIGFNQMAIPIDTQELLVENISQCICENFTMTYKKCKPKGK